MSPIICLVVALTSLGLVGATDSSMTAEAVFVNHPSIQGTVSFFQLNATSPVVISSNLKGLPSNNRLIVGIRRSITHECPQRNIDPFNPTVVNTTFPCSTSFPQGCKEGDLAMKFGAFPNGAFQIVDPNLHLIGISSIVGHGLYIFQQFTTYPAWNHKWPLACTNIAMTAPAKKMRYVVAEFLPDSILAGSMVFSQPYDDPTAQVTLTTTLDYNSATNYSVPPEILQRPAGNIFVYKIRVKPVTDGDGAIETPAEARCASAGGVFDPLLDILTGSTDFKEIERLCHLANILDKDECTRMARNFTQQPHYVQVPARDTLTDPFVSLSGANSIVGRSVSIEVADGSPFMVACATLVEVDVPTVSVQVPQGTVTLAQWDEFSPTLITAELTSPLTEWAVHEPPPSCQASAQGVLPYDPTHVNETLYDDRCTTTSPFRFADCRLGDLSGRWGVLTDGAVLQDFNAPLWGAYSFVSRAFVADSSTCASLAFTPTSSYTQWSALAHFDSDQVSGTVQFNETLPPSGVQSVSQTTVSISLSVSAAAVTVGVWYVDTSGSCASTPGVYNPARVVYPATDCSPFNQTDGCAVGDLSGKAGSPLILPATGATQQVFTLEGVPLHGAQSIVGHALYLVDSFGQHFACTVITATTTDSSNNNNNNNVSPSSKGLSDAAVAGIILGIIVGGVFLGVIVAKSRRRSSSSASSHIQLHDHSDMAVPFNTDSYA